MLRQGSLLTRAFTAIPALLVPLLALTMSSGGTAVAAPVGPPPPKLSITMTPDGFTIPGPNPRPGGYITFEVSTAVSGGQWLALMRPQPGVGFQQVMTEFIDAASPDPAVAMPALR